MKIPVKYNLRSLFVRKGTTLMTVVSIAFVVVVFVGVYSLGTGLEQAFSSTGDPANLLVLRDGARSETESGNPMPVYRDIAALPGVERGADGEPLAAGELIILQIFTRQDDSEANVIVRGVMPASRAVRPAFTIIEGRDFEPGTSEIIVGQQLSNRFPSLALGQSATLGKRDFRVVGVFEGAGSGIESEVWGARADIGDTFDRNNYVSSIRLRTSSPEAAAQLKSQIEGDQRWRMVAKPEDEYYAEQSSVNTAQFKILGLALAFLMGIGACFAAANTMYAQIANRGREIGTLRAIGFGRWRVMAAFLIEAAILGFMGGLAGILLALPLNGIRAGTTNFLTFSEISFELALTAPVLVAGVLLAVATALVGGLPPAWSASRRKIDELLRQR